MIFNVNSQSPYGVVTEFRDQESFAAGVCRNAARRSPGGASLEKKYPLPSFCAPPLPAEARVLGCGLPIVTGFAGALTIFEVVCSANAKRDNVIANCRRSTAVAEVSNLAELVPKDRDSS